MHESAQLHLAHWWYHTEFFELLQNMRFELDLTFYLRLQNFQTLLCLFWLGWARLSLSWLVQAHLVKFIFSKKATKIEKIFTVSLTLCSKCQIVGEDFVKFCGLLRKHKLYLFGRSFCTEVLIEDLKSTILPTEKKTLFERSSSCFIYSIGMCRDYT